MRYLGIDHGSKRIGLAVGDDDIAMALPLPQLQSTGRATTDAPAIKKVVDEHDIDIIVLGLPLHMDGNEGDQARRARAYGRDLGAALNVPVEFWDERLSTHAADGLLDDNEDLTTLQRRARRDSLAAKTFLQTFLEYRKNNPA